MTVRDRHPTPPTRWSRRVLVVSAGMVGGGLWCLFQANPDLGVALLIVAPFLPVLDWLRRRSAVSMHQLRQGPGKDFQVNNPDYYLSAFRETESRFTPASRQAELLEKKLHPDHAKESRKTRPVKR